MKLGEGDFREARSRAEVSRKADGAHAAAVLLEVVAGSEMIFGRSSGKCHVVVKAEELLREWGIVGQDTDWVIVDFEAVGGRFDDDMLFVVANHPVELGGGKLVAEVKVAEVHLREESLGFGDGGALTENPRYEFELGDVIFAVDVFIVNGVADEVQTSDAEAFFVDGVIEQRIVFWLVAGEKVRRNFGDIGNADHGIMSGLNAGFTIMKREIARNNDGGFAVRKFVVEIATEVRVFSFISSSCAHVCPFCF